MLSVVGAQNAVFKLGGVDSLQKIIVNSDCPDTFKAMFIACLGVCASYNTKIQIYLWKHTTNVHSCLKNYLFYSQDPEIVKQSLVALLELTVGNKKIQEQLINSDFLTMLKNVLNTSIDDGLIYAVVWTICEIAKGGFCC